MSSSERLDPEQAIDAIAPAAARLAAATVQEMTDTELRHEAERLYIASLVGQVNPLTNKPHSPTSAADAYEATPECAVHRAALKRTAVEKITAQAELDAAKLRATLAVTLAGAVHV